MANYADKSKRIARYEKEYQELVMWYGNLDKSRSHAARSYVRKRKLYRREYDHLHENHRLRAILIILFGILIIVGIFIKMNNLLGNKSNLYSLCIVIPSIALIFYLITSRYLNSIWIHLFCLFIFIGLDLYLIKYPSNIDNLFIGIGIVTILWGSIAFIHHKSWYEHQRLRMKKRKEAASAAFASLQDEAKEAFHKLNVRYADIPNEELHTLEAFASQLNDLLNAQKCMK